MTTANLKTIREEFERWVDNPHMLNRRTEPGYTNEYEHPWTSGAWAAWIELHSIAIDTIRRSK